MTTPPTIPQRDRLVHIDCLRALAALFVAVFHLVPSGIIPFGGESVPILKAVADFAHFMDFGRLGVMLFFIISGYVISHSILRYRSHGVGRFALSRFFRLYPAYWVNILVVLLLAGSHRPGLDYVLNLTMMQKFIGVPDVNSVFWTLAVELVFYALVVVLYLAAVLSNLRRLVLLFWLVTAYAMTAAMSHAYTDFYMPFGTPFFLTFMIGGSILRHVDEQGLQGDARVWIGLAVYLCCMAVISFHFYRDPGEFNKSWSQDLLINGSALMLFLFVNYIYRVQWRILAYLGLISYSLYLYHAVIGDWIIEQFQAFQLAPALNPWAVQFVLFAAAIMVASLSFHLIEKPAVGLGRRVSRRLFSETGAPAPSDPVAVPVNSRDAG